MVSFTINNKMDTTCDIALTSSYSTWFCVFIIILYSVYEHGTKGVNDIYSGVEDRQQLQYKLCTCLPCQFANYLRSIRNCMLLNLRDFVEKYKLSRLF